MHGATMRFIIVTTLRCVREHMPVWVMIEKRIEIILEEEELSKKKWQVFLGVYSKGKNLS